MQTRKRTPFPAVEKKPVVLFSSTPRKNPNFDERLIYM
jgi:hypothetical protein